MNVYLSKWFEPLTFNHRRNSCEHLISWFWATYWSWLLMSYTIRYVYSVDCNFLENGLQLNILKLGLSSSYFWEYGVSNSQIWVIANVWSNYTHNCEIVYRHYLPFAKENKCEYPITVAQPAMTLHRNLMKVFKLESSLKTVIIVVMLIWVQPSGKNAWLCAV